jgi:hypothetical protein
MQPLPLLLQSEAMRFLQQVLQLLVPPMLLHVSVSSPIAAAAAAAFH